MKKITNYKSYLAALVLSVTLFSCEMENETGDVKYVKPVVTIDKVAASVTEGGSVTFTLTTDTPLNQDLTYKLELVGGSGSFRDYETSERETEEGDGFGYIGHMITIPAYTSTYTFDITPLIDLKVEGTETFEFALTSDSYSRGLVAPGSEKITLTVNDYVSNDIGIELDWTQTYSDPFGTLHFGTYMGADGNEHDYADYDFDFYVFDASFNEVSGFAAATGAAPEYAELDASSLADGVYEVYADKYSDASDPEGVLSIPMTLTISKFGTWSKVIDVDYYTSNTPESAPNGLNGGEFLVVRFTKSGNTYTVNDPDTNEVLAQGRLAQARQAIKNLKKLKK